MTFFEKYILKNGRVFIVTEDGEEFDFCQEFRVVNVYRCLHSNKREVEIELIQDDGSKENFIMPRRTMLDPLATMVEHGLSVSKIRDYEISVSEILYDMEKKATGVYKHSKLGFLEVGGREIFLAHHPIGETNPQKALSEYIAPEITKPIGTLESWRDFVTKEIVGHPNLELALAIGGVAPVAHLLREDGIISDIPIIALVGPSTSGKTTALKLMASIFGTPKESDGIIRDLNSTQNAFFAQLGNSKGVPALIDEVSAVPEWDFTKVLYNLPKGHDKSRCNGDGEVKKTITYSGAIIFTGEYSLLEQTNSSRGLYARLLELTFSWTDDADHAKRIEAGCQQNCGTAVYPYVEWLMKNRDCLAEEFEAQYAFLLETLDDLTEIESRLLKISAMILVSAIIMKTSLKIPLNIDGIRDVLINHHEEMKQERDPIEQAFEKIKAQLMNNWSKFPTKDSILTANSIYGFRETHECKNVVWVFGDIFQQWFAKAGITDFKGYIRAFANRGWIYKDKKRRHYTVTRKVQGLPMTCYGIWLNEVVISKPKKDKKRKGSQMKKLLSEVEED